MDGVSCSARDRAPRKIAWNELQASLAQLKTADTTVVHVGQRVLRESPNFTSRERQPTVKFVEEDLKKPTKKKKKKKEEEKKGRKQSVSAFDEMPSRSTHLALGHVLLAAVAPLGIARDEMFAVRGQVQLIDQYDRFAKKKGKKR